MKINMSHTLVEILISALEEKLSHVEKCYWEENEEAFTAYSWFCKRHPDLIPDWVEFVYKEIPDRAKKVVGAFHDDVIDLSTIPCTGTDFDPWKYE